MQIPTHVAIIPDANRRWARRRGLKPWEGHEAGAENVEKIMEAAKECGVKYLSFWGSSEDNLRKRPFEEKRALLNIYRRYFQKLIDSPKVHKNKIKINVIGNWEKQFPSSLRHLIEEVIEKTKDYDQYFANFFLAYSGDIEIKNAIMEIAKDFKAGKIARISDSTIKNYLLTKELPNVDLLIRSGSIKDPHLSAGFMMWDTKDSQLFFSKKDWPDFDKAEFKKAVSNYGERVRRYGE